MTPPEPIALHPDSPPERVPVWGYLDLVLFVGAWLPSLFFSALLVGVLRAVSGGFGGNRALEALLVQFLAYGFIFVCLYLLLRIRYDQPFWASMAWEGAGRAVPIGLFCGPLLALLIAVLGLLLAPNEIDNPFRELMRDRLSVILIGVFATTLGPLCEELAFRGFFQPLLSRTFGTAAGILLANLPFALMHGPQYAWSWQHLVLVGLAGMVFGAARHYFGSTAAAVGMHATYNLTFFSGFVIQRGHQLNPW